MDGIINVYKEKGYTSFDVVAKLRGILKQRKIGHTGTLDPDAEGVLPVCVGRATKVCDFLTEKDKVYEAVLHLGVTTDTQDITGHILEEKPILAEEEQVKTAISEFVGVIQQVPPMYSALKVNGQKLCDLARKGIEVERKSREIQIYDIEILSVELPFVRMQVHCSKGTYIRTLCHDIGKRLGCGGCMESLLRVKTAGFELKDAHKLEEIAVAVIEKEDGIRELPTMLIPVEEVLQEYPMVRTKVDGDRLLDNGNRIPVDLLDSDTQERPENLRDNEKVRMYNSQKRFIGIYQYIKEKSDFKAVKIFT